MLKKERKTTTLSCQIKTFPELLFSFFFNKAETSFVCLSVCLSVLRNSEKQQTDSQQQQQQAQQQQQNHSYKQTLSFEFGHPKELRIRVSWFQIHEHKST